MSPMQPFIPPKPDFRTQTSRIGGILARGGRSLLDLLPKQAYAVQMGVSRILGRGVFLVNAPETVREVMVAQVAQYPKHHYLADILQPLIGCSLFNANGDAWAQQRRIVEQAFAHANLRRAFPVMRDCAADLLTRLDAVAQGGAPWDVDSAMGHVTSDIIFRTILSAPLSDADAGAVHAAFLRYQHGAQRVMALSALGLPTMFHRYACRRMGNRIRASFDARVRARFMASQQGAPGQPQDMLDALIQARDPLTGTGLDAGELVDQVGTLFLAGHETSASTLAWALYLLGCQGELQQAVRDEIASAWGAREPEFGDTRQLALLHDVFREVLRLYPPIAFYLREASAQGCLREKPVAAGDMVAVSPWVVHRHQAFWERPDEFDPMRFCTEAGKASARTSYLPFGLGPRACPGAAFATQESLLILAQIVRRYRIERVPGHTPVPVARLTLRSANGVRLRLQRLAG